MPINVRSVEDAPGENQAPGTEARCLVRYTFWERMWQQQVGCLECPAAIARGDRDALLEWVEEHKYDADLDVRNTDVTDTEDLEVENITDIAPPTTPT